jgi:3-deoxy-D-manno-octulosonic-acid transferase
MRRSALPEAGAGGITRALLLDSMGELAGVFRLADIVFVGGTLCSRGGHNILEPAFFGKPVIVGPHMENFSEIAHDFRSADACLTVPDEAGLEAALRRLIAGDVPRAELGERGRQQALRKTGATQRAVDEAKALYEVSLPRPFPSAVLSALAVLWRAGSRWKRARDLGRAQTLPKPVVSIGGIGVGGVGKTPFALSLAERLRSAGCHPAFLTRGYRRTSPDTCTVVPAGGPATVEQTGDEAQLLVRSGFGPVGICALRSQAGAAVLKQFEPDLFLLDDGFQHASLSRTVDLVLIDTLDPFGGFNVIPAGRLREPLEALGRATAFILMRCEEGRTYEGILRVLRRYNPTAPVFYARLEAVGWVDAATGKACAGVGHPGAAFCGLANPATFWRSLEQKKLAPAFRVTFPDHHRYHPRDLQRLGQQAHQAGVAVLWTTEKDAVNLPFGWQKMELPYQIRALQVRVRLNNEPQLMRWLLEHVNKDNRESNRPAP